MVKRLYRFPISECPGNGFKCNDGTCVPEHSFCNSIFDCSDGSDEPEQSCKREYRKKKSGEYCPLQCGNGRCRSAAVIINKNFLCLFLFKALTSFQLCSGSKVLCTGQDGCGDNSDETQCEICRKFHKHRLANCKFISKNKL